MGTEIKTWQIIDGKLNPLETSLSQDGKTEPYDLEPWLESHPSIIGDDIIIIGRQVQVASKSGRIDLLGIDNGGNLVVIELKRDKIARDALAQAIDYASDVASWEKDKISEVCGKYYTEKSLEDVITESFPDVDIGSLKINATQRIILVGFVIESSLERMVEWLSGNYGVNVNAVVLKYIKTAKGEELLAKTSIISEEVEKERVRKKFIIKAPNVTLKQLVDGGLIEDGQTLYFFHGKTYENELAEIVANENKLRYKLDETLHSVSDLAKQIDKQLGLKHDDHSIAGPKYWKTEDDKLLHDLNEVIRGRDQE